MKKRQAGASGIARKVPPGMKVDQRGKKLILAKPPGVLDRKKVGKGKKALKKKG